MDVFPFLSRIKIISAILYIIKLFQKLMIINLFWKVSVSLYQKKKSKKSLRAVHCKCFASRFYWLCQCYKSHSSSMIIQNTIIHFLFSPKNFFFLQPFDWGWIKLDVPVIFFIKRMINSCINFACFLLKFNWLADKWSDLFESLFFFFPQHSSKNLQIGKKITKISENGTGKYKLLGLSKNSIKMLVISHFQYNCCL